MGVNPFDPPRTDLEGGGGDDGPAAGKAIPAAALRELVGSAPWARWTVLLTMISLPLTVLNSIVAMSKAKQTAEIVGQVATLVVGLPVSILFLVLYRRYSARASELAGGEPRAAGEVIDAQRSLFKAYGILMIVMVVFVVLIGVLGAVAGTMMRPRP
jgi:hypothetical protein